MTDVQVTQEQIKKVVAIIDGVKESILARWKKATQVTGKTDLIAVIEPNESDVSILILPRIPGLALLEEKGCDTKHPNLKRLMEAARGLTSGSNAIWVVVLYAGHTHLTKMIHQPMSQGGLA